MDTPHEVFNPPEPLSNYNLFEGNRGLRDALNPTSGSAVPQPGGSGKKAGVWRKSSPWAP
ncbi:hypothetical protein [Polaromonas sp. CG9_12]|nr:hypothetical protein [Polaromonas sp. CG_9.11]CDS49763.1 hypothetical protein [Polaromonas sp. CG9_12]